MNERGIAPKLIADQQVHGVDLNQNVYAMTSVESRLEAVETLLINAAEMRQNFFGSC